MEAEAGAGENICFDENMEESSDSVALSKQPLSAAQKKREKQRLKKKLAKEAADTEDGDDHQDSKDGNEEQAENSSLKTEEGEEGTGSGQTKKKAVPKEKETAKGKKKGPSQAKIAQIQAAIQKAKDEEERFLRDEEEKERRLLEAEAARQEKLKEEQERKERRKQKEKERKARLKEEGKLLTAKQRQDRQRAQQFLESLKAQGSAIPEAGVEQKRRLGTRLRPKRNQQRNNSEDETHVEMEGQMESLSILDDTGEDLKEEEKIKDAWDDSDEEGENKSSSTKSVDVDVLKAREADGKAEISSDEDSLSDIADYISGESKQEVSCSENAKEDVIPSNSRLNRRRSSSGEDMSWKKEEAGVRIERRRLENEKNRTLDVLRSPVVCVLGHVDTGKTKILDKLRRTHVQDGEAGGITQQIGATNVPIEAVKEAAKIVKGFTEIETKVPGLLLIDTPGHESFSNLRSRGSSLCDIAILVVDIMHGLEPQTLESINLLRKKKTPFIVALNKIDRIYDWNPSPRKDIRDSVKQQAKHAASEFKKRSNEIIVEFAEQGLNAALFFDNPDPKEYISMVPTSALTGEGMGNLMGLIVEYSQTMVVKRLMYSNELQATVLEVKAIPGLGTTIDVILINGTLREGDKIILAGTEGPIVTQIRSLLTPQPMKELRVKNTYIEYKEIKGAIGVKIAGKDLESAIAGLNLLVAQHPDEVEICKEEVSRELSSALSSFRIQERGVYVQASTLGSLEALLEFLRTSSIPYSGIRIGPVVKKDVMKASIMIEHDSQYAVILAFDVKIERDAQDLADHVGVKIFQADIIYHLFDKFTAYQEELKGKRREQFKHIAVFPSKLKILEQFIFNTRDPIVIGVNVEAGTLKIGTPICVPAKEFLEIGKVTSIEINHKPVEKATKGQEVCVKIEPLGGESPKMLGRHFEVTDMLVSKISRESIDACKEYFRNDLQKADWQLMVELKKQFQIM